MLLRSLNVAVVISLFSSPHFQCSIRRTTATSKPLLREACCCAGQFTTSFAVRQSVESVRDGLTSPESQAHLLSWPPLACFAPPFPVPPSTATNACAPPCRME